MEITEVRVSLLDGRYGDSALKAFCSVLVDDCLVIRDLKIIKGDNGLFVAFPCRQISSKCATCRARNPMRAKFCNECGTNITKQLDPAFRTHVDIIHPIDNESRDLLEEEVINAYLDRVDEERESRHGRHLH